MGSKCACAWFLVGMAIALGGCNTMPVRNQPLEHYTQGAGYRYTNIAPAEGNSDSLCVILTFSGGGTRAAAFAYGVLEKLRDTEIVWEGQRRRLLDEVDVISSVSGGSLPAAYYGLFGNRIFEEFPDKVLYRDIQGDLIKQVFSPATWPKLFSSLYGRTDMMADDFSRKIFEKKTFADLLARNRRPFLIINATNVSSGNRFDFTQRQFDLLYSDLATYPIGNAVAASAAFPGLLTPMTLRNYPKEDDYVRPAWVDEELQIPDANRMRHRQAEEANAYIKSGGSFVHLTDGGVADNLAILPVIQLLGDSYPGDNASSVLAGGAVKKVVIILANAECSTQAELDTKGQGLGLLKMLGVVTSTPMGNFSAAELALFRLFAQQSTDKQMIREQITELYGPDAVAQHFPQLVTPNIDYHLVEVDYSQVPDEIQRAYLNNIPTAFRLKREEVDTLRDLAGKILDSNTEFQRLLAGLQ